MTKTTLAFLTAASALVLSSCQDEDYGFTSDEVRASVYKRNFESAVGEISEDQIWDFSSYNLRKLGLAGGPSANSSGSAGQTRALPGLVTKYNNDPSKWYTVSSSTITWLNAHLKEKVDNTEYTSPFEWVPDADSGPKGVFYIIPIYQGQTGMVWNLELVDINISGSINNSTLLWTKSENIRYTQDYSNWEEFFYESGVDALSSYRRLDFANAFSKISSNTTDLKVAFSVNTKVTGAFYLTLGGNRTRLTFDNAETLFRNCGQNAQGQWFTLDPEKNISITSSQGLSKDNVWDDNIIDFSKLIGLTINGTEVDADVLKTLSFEIPNNDALPAADQLFQHWSRDYIRVFVHYNGGGDPEYINLFDLDTDGQHSYTKHNTVNKYNVQTRPIKIDMSKIEGTSFAFNLKTIKRTDGDSPYSEIGDDHRSDGGFMSLITHFSEPVIVKSDFQELMKRDFGIELIDNFEYKVIGCEDAGYNGKGSDHDFNDVVFLLVGDKLPNQVIKKRYMIEDLGSTLDFDFNDIVVDVTETSTSNVDGTKNYTQTAVIRNLCGTIPFRVKIGNKYFGNVDGNDCPIMRGHNPNEIEFDPSTYNNGAHYADYSWTASQNNVAAGVRPSLRDNYWDPEKNNILVEVWPSYASEDGNVDNVYWNGGTSGSTDNIKEVDQTKYNNVQIRKIVEFPKTGQVPYIIATDQTVMWMKECHNIPSEWVDTKPQNYPNYPTFEMGDYIPDSPAAGSGTIGEFGNLLTNRTSATAGSIVLNNVKTGFESSTIVISKDDISKAYLGDVLVVKVEGDVYDSSRLKFTQTGSTKGITNVGTNGNVIVTGDYEIPMTEEIMTSLRNNGLTISGTNVTVESVTVRSGVNTATSKSKTTADVAAGSWVIAENEIMNTYSDNVHIKRSELQQLYVGDKIVVKLSGLRSDSQIGFKKGWDSWNDITYSDYNVTGGAANSDGNNIIPTGDITIDVTASNIASLRDANGDLIIQGYKVTIESVSVQTAGSNAQPVANPTKISGGTSVYNTKEIINSYNRFPVAATNFTNISEGDQIIVKVSNVRTNSALGFRTLSGAQVSWFGDQHGNVYNNNGNGELTGDYALTVTSANINDIKNGISITGAYLTVTDVLIKSTRHVTVAALPAEGGSVKIGDGGFAASVEGDYDKGTDLNLTASAPNSGYSFVKWSSGDWTYSRTLTLNDNSNPVALYQKGTTVLDLSSSGYAFTDGGSWDNCRYNDSGKGAANYTALENALNTTNNKLHIYFSEKTGTVKLWTFGGHRDAENDNWGWMQVTGDLSFDNYELTVTLTDNQVNQIKNYENHGFVISNKSGKAINMYKIIVE